MNATVLIEKALSIKKCSSLPPNFNISEYQQQLIEDEIPRVINDIQQLDESIINCEQLREKVKNALLQRFYEVTIAAQEAITQQNLRRLNIDTLKVITKGAFIIITRSGSIHYFRVNKILPRCCESLYYDRQSYYNLKLSQSVNTGAVGSQHATQHTIAKDPIRIQITRENRLKLSRRNGNIFETILVSTPIYDIFTSDIPEDTTKSYTSISTSISSINCKFARNIMEESKTIAPKLENPIPENPLFDNDDEQEELDDSRIYSQSKKLNITMAIRNMITDSKDDEINSILEETIKKLKQEDDKQENNEEEQ